MEIVTKKRFEKDIKTLKKRKKQFSKLEEALNLVSRGDVLPKQYCNHPLVGNWSPCWELHIEPDWLLIYDIKKDKGQLILYRTGSHSDLF